MATLLVRGLAPADSVHLKRVGRPHGGDEQTGQFPPLARQIILEEEGAARGAAAHKHTGHFGELDVGSGRQMLHEGTADLLCGHLVATPFSCEMQLSR